MLKELWKKTMGHDAAPSLGRNATRALGGGKGFRLIPHMTHTGEFHLQRLTDLIEGRYGKSFMENGDEGIRQMIRFAARVQDQDVQRELLLFYLNCSPVIQEYLRSEHVLGDNAFLPR